MTTFQEALYQQYLSDGRAEDAEAYRQSCLAQEARPAQMTEEVAREAAQTHVFCDMCLGEIQAACRSRGIPVGKSRGKMEQLLIDALTKEYMG